MAVAFEGLSARLQEAFRRLRGKGKLTEDDITETLREVRLALLEADVHLHVVKDFVAKVKEKTVGLVLDKGFNPAMTVIRAVNDELTALLGGENTPLTFVSNGITVVMMVGLQGAGKTTTVAKLAKHLASMQRRPLLVACDIYRPAAITQLHVLGQQIGVPVFSLGDGVNPVEIATKALAHAKEQQYDTVIVDTAGRLHIDEALMDELQRIRQATQPQEILLTIDAMTGQDAVSVAEQFHARLTITGTIVTKLDGDTRGGAALSVKAVTGQPIKFAATGEKLDALEPFYPERMASRILGMGDMLTLIEKAQATIDDEQAEELERKLRQSTFTLNDFYDQIQQFKKMGPLEQIMDLLPGMGQLKQLKDAKIDPKQVVRTEAIIQSMTKKEKEHPEIIHASRRKRIAVGSGTTIQDVNRLLTQFEQMKKMMKKMTREMDEKKSKQLAKKSGKKTHEPSVKKSTYKKGGFPF